MRRELLERVELQRVYRILTLKGDDRSERPKFLLAQQLLACLRPGGEGRLQLVQASATVPGAVLDRPCLRVRAQRSIKWRSPGVSGCWPVGR